nr:unnamed protein product [Callosobruchus analis]
MQILNNKSALRLENDDIQICYRVGKKEENKPRGIFLKFKNQNIKEAIYRKKKLFKGSGIVVREDLTKVRLELLNYAIEKIGLKSMWTENSKIYAIGGDRKIAIIRNKQDVAKMA